MTEPLVGPDVVSAKFLEQSVIRRFVSQGGESVITLGIWHDGEARDPEDGTLKLKVYYKDPAELYPPEDQDPRGELIINVDHTSIQKDEVGKYYYQLGPQATSRRGTLTAIWSYEYNNTDWELTDHLQVMDRMPLYDRLSEEDKMTVLEVSWRFADLFDSTTGGPYATEPFQTHFDYERITQLMRIAIGKLNVMGYPITTFSIDPGFQQPPQNWRPLLSWATYHEVIRHLMRVYTEIPDVRNANITYDDRRDYLTRWKTVLDEEKKDLDKAVIMTKRKLLNLGSSSMLVSGGIYGSGARSLFMYGQYASAARSMRFYPAYPSVAWSSRVC